MEGQRYGGGWSDQKLQVLHDYLVPYLQIFRNNPGARKLSPGYLDAFAGCGTREESSPDLPPQLFESAEDEEEAKGFVATSPRVALALPDAFDRYVFIERHAGYAEQLKRMIATEYPARAAISTVHTGDANSLLPQFCRNMRQRDRAVMFLDPFGAQVDWSTLEAIATSQKVDLWLLFPYTGLLRMLPRERMPDDAWATRLTRMLGTDEWRNWYKQTQTTDLFGDTNSEVAREADVSKIMGWVASRLKTIFHATVQEPLILRNSRGSPLFMLTFAAGNKKGAPTACRIAQDIITAQRRTR